MFFSHQLFLLAAVWSLSLKAVNFIGSSARLLLLGEISNRVLQHWPQSLKQSPSLTICIITTVFHWKYRGLSLKKITVHSPSHWLLSLNKPYLKVSFTTGDLTRDCGLYPKHNLNLRIKTESVTVGADAAEYIWFLGQID